MTLNFKTLVLSLFVLTAVSSKAQDLTFSRVIDTLITVEVGSEYVDITSGLVGDVITPPAGKVWKVNNILTPGIYQIPTGSWTGSVQPVCHLSLILPGGVAGLSSSNISNSSTGDQPTMGSSVTGVSYPFWLNEGASIQISLVPKYVFSNDPISTEIKNVSCYAFVSIIEFDI